MKEMRVGSLDFDLIIKFIQSKGYDIIYNTDKFPFCP